MGIKINLIILFSLTTLLCYGRVQSDRDALAYCYAHPKSFVVLFWPAAEAVQPIELLEKHLTQRFHVIYKKEISLENDGPLMFVRQVYARQKKRIGSWEDNFKGARHKAQQSFITGSKLRAYLLDAAEYNELKKFKKSMRKLYHYNFVHVNDTHEETVSIAQMVFSDPTIEFYNSCSFVEFKKFEALFDQYRKFLKENRIDPTSCCVVGQAVRAAYGIQDCERFDFIESHMLTLDSKKELDDENNSIIYDHDAHFFYVDMKFARLPEGILTPSH